MNAFGAARIAHLDKGGSHRRGSRGANTTLRRLRPSSMLSGAELPEVRPDHPFKGEWNAVSNRTGY
jgi:hypothetical protein